MKRVHIDDGDDDDVSQSSSLLYTMPVPQSCNEYLPTSLLCQKRLCFPQGLFQSCNNMFE
eukprot:2801636-Pleurochrysis_carterae.AAC.1